MENAWKETRLYGAARLTGGGTRVLDGELVRGHEHWKRTNGRCFSEAWILNGENRSVALLGDILAGIKRDRNVSRELKKRKGKKSKSDIIPDIMDMDRWDDLIWLHYIIMDNLENNALKLKSLDGGRFKGEEILFEMI